MIVYAYNNCACHISNAMRFIANLQGWHNEWQLSSSHLPSTPLGINSPQQLVHWQGHLERSPPLDLWHGLHEWLYKYKSNMRRDCWHEPEIITIFTAADRMVIGKTRNWTLLSPSAAVYLMVIEKARTGLCYNHLLQQISCMVIGKTRNRTGPSTALLPCCYSMLEALTAILQHCKLHTVRSLLTTVLNNPSCIEAHDSKTVASSSEFGPLHALGS